MLAELLDRLVDLVRQGSTPHVTAFPRLPRRMLVTHVNGETDWIDIPPPKRNVFLYGFADLIVALMDSKICPNPEVYITSERIQVFADRDVRDDILTVNLQTSQRFKLCHRLESPREGELFVRPVKDVLRMLRNGLHGTGADGLAAKLSALQFRVTKGQDVSIAHGRESMGRAVEAEVVEAESLPQEWELSVPIWANVGFSGYRGLVKLGIELDFESAGISLSVLSDQCHRAMNDAMAQVKEDLEKALPEPGTTVLLGEIPSCEVIVP